MAGTEDIGYQGARRYRIGGKRHRVAEKVDFDRRTDTDAESAKKWACVNMGPGRRDQHQEHQAEQQAEASWRQREPVRDSYHEASASALRRPARRQKEPVRDPYHEQEYDYYDGNDGHDDFREPLPKREMFVIRAARGAIRVVAAAWSRVWLFGRVGRNRIGNLGRPFIVAAAVFAAGALLENQIHFLGWAANMLVTAVLSIREWVNPGPQTALLLTGLIAVTGAWLLKRVIIGGRGPASPARRRAIIPQEMLDRHR